MSEGKKVPKIRFPGYTDPWKLCKLGETVSLRGRIGFRGYTQADLVDAGSGAITFSPADIDDSGNISLTNNKYSSWDKYEESPEIKVREGDILFTKTASIGKIGFVSKLMEKATINPQLALLTPIGNTDGYFIFLSIRTDEYMKKVRDITGGSSVPTMSQEKLKELTFMVPSVHEQQSISEFFSNLDDLITLQKCEYVKWKELKKGMLQKMFPKEGESVPGIRFPGFKEAWEWRKITDIGEVFIGLVTTMTSHYTDKGALLIRNSDIKDGRFEFGEKPIYLDDEFAMSNASRMHRIGDVVTVHTGDIGTSAVITEKEAGSIGFATIVTRPDIRIIMPNFLCSYLNTDAHKKFAINKATGDGRNNYNLKDYYDCLVPVPSLYEQEEVSRLIVCLNNQILHCEKELFELNLLKKGLLQQMFAA